MMKHYLADAGAGLAQAAPAPHPAERLASAQALRVRRPASETAAASRLTRSRAGLGCAGGAVTG